MLIKEYQEQSNLTDQVASTLDLRAQLTPILGLVGRVGALSTDYMRNLRDGAAYTAFNDGVSDALGDILWYVSNIAQKNGIDLEEVACRNIEKNKKRWDKIHQEAQGFPMFDSDFHESERFPMDFEIQLISISDGDVSLFYKDESFGDPLGDNSAVDDGYRFHDVFHLSFVAHLGWSPVLRGKKFFNCKRKSCPTVDEIEDGGRAAVIDEAVAALIFNEAKKSSFYDGVNYVGKSLLQLIAQLTSHLEVRACSAAQWEAAILNAFDVWRKIKVSQNGRLIGSRATRRLSFVEVN